MGLNKKTISVSKTNLGLGNVQNLSPAEIAAILRSTRFSNYPSQLDEAERSDWSEFINSLNKPSNLPEPNKSDWKKFITDTIVETSQLPLGAIIMWASDKIPSGFAICDGRQLNRSEGYGDIIELLGGGPKAPYTKLPDLTNRFPVGSGDKYGLCSQTGDGYGGDETVTLTGEQSGIQKHKVYPESDQGTPKRTRLDDENSHWHAYLGDDQLCIFDSNKGNNFKDFYDTLPFSMKNGYTEWDGGYVVKNRYVHPSGMLSFNGTSYGRMKYVVRGNVNPIYVGDWRTSSRYAPFDLTSTYRENSTSGFWRTDGCSQHNHPIPEYEVGESPAIKPHTNIPPYCGLYFIMKVKLS